MRLTTEITEITEKDYMTNLLMPPSLNVFTLKFSNSPRLKFVTFKSVNI